MKLTILLQLFVVAVVAHTAIGSSLNSARTSSRVINTFQSALSVPELTSCMNPDSPTCGWYTECMEKAHPCGPKGYVMDFGYPYCLKFRDAKDLSPAGQAWRDKTMVCLQQSLVPMLGASGPSSEVCPEIDQTGFDSHVHCYTSSPSICSLPWSDLWNIVDIIGPGFLDPQGWKQSAQAIRICLCQWSGAC